MKVKFRRMIFLFIGFFLGWNALWFMLIALFEGTYMEGSLQSGIASILMLLSSLFLALGLTIEETAVEDVK